MAFKLLVAVVIFKLVWSRPVVQDVNLYPQELKPLEYQAAASENVPDVVPDEDVNDVGPEDVNDVSPEIPGFPLSRRPAGHPYVAEPSRNVNQVPAQRRTGRSHSVGIPAPGLPNPRRPVAHPYIAEPSENVNQAPAQRKKGRSHSATIVDTNGPIPYPVPIDLAPNRVELPFPKGY